MQQPYFSNSTSTAMNSDPARLCFVHVACLWRFALRSPRNSVWTIPLRGRSRLFYRRALSDDTRPCGGKEHFFDHIFVDTGSIESMLECLPGSLTSFKHAWDAALKFEQEYVEAFYVLRLVLPASPSLRDQLRSFSGE